ncbi:hypothetical protein QE152_g10355 [Popillia japonica]|uniref:Uncharacterized protein n=1 Tax=Popillia japonica TaxID=7064 RepID=A0AAW1LRS6_POPJA
MCCRDKCANGVCNSDGLCQCPDCSGSINKGVNCQNGQNDTGDVIGGLDADHNCGDTINKGVNCQNGQNDTGDVISGLDADHNCGDTSLGEDMISKTRHTTIITILACFTVILLVTMTVLVFIALKMKRALPLNQAKIKILFGGLG